MPDPSEIVELFIATWSGTKAEAKAGIRSYFLPTTVYENVGTTRTVGPDEAIAMSALFESQLGYDHMKVDTLFSASNGDIVFNERIDRLINAQGREIAAIRVLGIFEIREGKIAAWRDYFDSTTIP